MLCQVCFESFGKFTSGKHHPPATTFALEPDIRAETSDNPFVGATRMLFSEAELIIEAEVG